MSMVAIRTSRALYVAGRAGQIREVCREVRRAGAPLPSVATWLAQGGPNPWIERPRAAAR